MREIISISTGSSTNTAPTSAELLANAVPTNGLGSYDRKAGKNIGIVILRNRLEAEGLRNQTEARAATSRREDHQG